MIDADGLRLCDGEGKLTSVLEPGVTLACRLPDSKHILIAARNSVNWGNFADTLLQSVYDEATNQGTRVDDAWLRAHPTNDVLSRIKDPNFRVKELWQVTQFEVRGFAITNRKVETVEPPSGEHGPHSLPCWRSTGELCYAGRVASTNRQDGPHYGILLWSPSTKQKREISRDWPPEARGEWLR